MYQNSRPQTEEHKPPRKARDVFFDIYYQTIPIISINLYWVLFTIPVVTAPAAVFALFHCSDMAVRGDSTGWSDFIEGFRKYFWTSWLWFLIDAAVTAILGVNIWFYQSLGAIWSSMVEGLMIGILILWLFIQFYVPAVIVMQEKKSLRQSLLNAAALVAFRPVVMGGTALILVGLFYLSTFIFIPLWVFFTAGLGAYFTSRVTLRTVQRMQKQQNKAKEQNQTPPPVG
jgi:uncharacterized membrane protein YesL